MRKINSELKERLKKIRLLILDVDGVLTDNGVFISDDGMEAKKFNISDGMGIYLAQKAGIEVAFISGRKSKATQLRAKELGIKHAFLDASQKNGPYQKIKGELKIEDQEIAYVGDDLLDVPVLRKVGLPIAVKNSNSVAKKYAAYVTKANGGQGAVREVIDLILESKRVNPEDFL